MNGNNMAITKKFLLIIILSTTTWVYGDNTSIEGDWRLTLTELGQSFIIRISTKPNGTLAATSMGIQLDKITFKSGKLHFEGGSPLCIFEGTIKEDGLVFEGQLQQGTQQWPAVLMHIEEVLVETKDKNDTEVAQASEEQFKNPKKLVAWWKLDEADGNDVADSSGNACWGKLIGNPQWQPEGGKVGGALEFDGDGDYVQIGNESAFDIAGPITVAAWIKVNLFDKRWQALITKGDTSWRLQRTAEGDTFAFHCTGITSVASRWPEGIEGKKNVNDGQWHHVVGVYDGSEVLLYIDGLLDSSSEASGTIQTNNSVVIIGGNSEQTGREWNGLIDEVSIIGGAIDANAVHALYTGADPNTIAQMANPNLQGPGKLLAWWKFDDDANDSAGANHGTLHGDPTYVAGKYGQAIALDGDDYVDCGNSSVLNFGTSDWTVSAWIKTTQTGTDEDDEHKNRGAVFANGGDQTGGIRYALIVNETSLGRIALVTDDDASKIQATASTAVNDGMWHHIVGMRNAGRLRIYVDGKLGETSLIPTGYDLSGVSQHNVYIGTITDNRDNSLVKFFDGLIDEVCVFTCALDANSVGALYSGRDPMKVAQEAKAVIEPQPRQAVDGNIEGEWKRTSETLGRSCVIKIWRKTDDTLGATLTAEDSEGNPMTMPFDKVNVTNGKLRLEAASLQSIYEGTLENSFTIKGQWQQQGQALSLDLKRIEQVLTETGDQSDSDAAQSPPDTFQESYSGSRGSPVTTLILVFILVGIIGAIVLFVMKSSIRR